jgi:hypothetical protein
MPCPGPQHPAGPTAASIQHNNVVWCHAPCNTSLILTVHIPYSSTTTNVIPLYYHPPLPSSPPQPPSPIRAQVCRRTPNPAPLVSAQGGCATLTTQSGHSLRKPLRLSCLTATLRYIPYAPTALWSLPRSSQTASMYGTVMDDGVYMYKRRGMVRAEI